MTGAEWLVWGCLLLIGHTYVFYPCVLFLAYALAQVRQDLRYLARRNDRRRRPLAGDALPPVTLIIPAYNEESQLRAKLANVEEVDYPRDRLQVVIVSDGSTDGTNAILAEVAHRYDVVILPVRHGKANALNEGVARARHDVLVMSDTSTQFRPDAVRQLVRHFADPTVGVVCGALRFVGNLEFEQTEGVYWRYEIALRLMEARLGATLTASGAIYALRLQAFQPLRPTDVIDDFVIPMNARRLGFRILFDPEAEALETAAASVRDEFTRRVRIAMGSFRALREFAGVPLGLFGALAFFSHKVLRWVLPMLMIGVLVGSALLLDRPFYRALFAAQLFFYLWAAVGFALRHRAQRVRFALFGYFLVAINLAYLIGFFRVLVGRRETTWQRVS
jgi:cellulose synthase/poly-beta-1,6-N-acetylglucosamine synthase-like glycosyltransferase